MSQKEIEVILTRQLASYLHFVSFHHDPAHTDDDLDRLIATAMATVRPPFTFTSGIEGTVFTLGTSARLDYGKGILQGMELSSGLREGASL